MGAWTRFRDFMLSWQGSPGPSTYPAWVEDYVNKMYGVLPGLTLGPAYEPDPIGSPGIYLPLGASGDKDGEIYLSDNLTPAQCWIWQNAAWNPLSAGAGAIPPTVIRIRGKYEEDVDDVGLYRESTGGVFPTAITWWTSGAKITKVKETLITRDVNQLPTTIVWKFYDAGILAKTYTDTITYSGVTETSRTRSVV